jgi:glycosyltransferase involved in cell wall biosynthesis
MAVAGIAMMKDEADIARPTIINMAHNVDFLVLADNGSTDGTRELIEKLSETYPITLLDDEERGYYQSAKMTALATVAGDMGADWVVPFDADEVWYNRFGDTLKDLLENVKPQWLTVAAELYDHVSTGLDLLDEVDPTVRMGWRRDYAAKLNKVACRVRDDLTIEQGNHGARYNGGATKLKSPFCVRHFAYRSPAQFVRKVRNGAAAYAASDLPDNQGSHWRGYGRILEQFGEETLIRDVYEKWFWRANPREYAMIEGDVSEPLVYDPAPVKR